MKRIKNISILLIGAGAFLGFVGLLAAIFPQIENPQIQLIYSSFQTVHANAALNGINSFIMFVIRSCYLFLVIGLAAFSAGLFLNFRFASRPAAPVRQASPTVSAPRALVSPAPAAVSLPAEKPPYQILEDDILPEWSMGPITAPVLPGPSPAPAQESNPFLTYGRGNYAPPADRRRNPVEVPAPNAAFMRPSTQKRPSEAVPPPIVPTSPPHTPAAAPTAPLTPIRSTLSSQGVPLCAPAPATIESDLHASKIVIRSTMGKKR